MYAVVTDSDRVIVRFEQKKVADIVIVENLDEDTFYTLWRREGDGQYQIMWRGTYASCLKEFRDITEDLMAEQSA